MFTQHIEKQRNVNTLNQNDINNSVNNANVHENELTYQFQRWDKIIQSGFWKVVKGYD